MLFNFMRKQKYRKNYLFKVQSIFNLLKTVLCLIIKIFFFKRTSIKKYTFEKIVAKL